MMKEEALKLADFIEKHMVEFGLILGEVSRDHIVGTIRKLVAELDKQSEPVVYWDGKHFASKEKSSLADIPLYTAPQTKPCKDCGEINPAEIHTCSPQTKPLSDEEIMKEWQKAHKTGGAK